MPLGTLSWSLRTPELVLGDTRLSPVLLGSPGLLLGDTGVSPIPLGVPGWSLGTWGCPPSPWGHWGSSLGCPCPLGDTGAGPWGQRVVPDLFGDTVLVAGHSGVSPVPLGTPSWSLGTRGGGVPVPMGTLGWSLGTYQPPWGPGPHPWVPSLSRTGWPHPVPMCLSPPHPKPLPPPKVLRWHPGGGHPAGTCPQGGGGGGEGK